MRKKRYDERKKRLEFATFMENVKRTFPFSTTKNVQLTRKEMAKSYLLTEIPDRVKASDIFFTLKPFGALRDFSIVRPNPRTRKGTTSIFGEFQNEKDGLRFLDYSKNMNLFEASAFNPLIDTIPPRHRRGYSRKYLS
jgi:hypothetical protein